MMENFKFVLFSIIVLAIMTLVGYWAIITIEPGSVSAERQKREELEQKNKELEEEMKKLAEEIRSTKEIQNVVPEPKNEPSEGAITTASKYQNLINDLEKLIEDNILIKEKSRGTRVGTIQTFLNIYNDTSKRIDNDFGVGTKTDVINFQKAENLTADGEVGPTTVQKMIDWLKKQ